ncbi:MAG: hypothetical protein E5X23_08345 [Mesorhizobium sp.]|uniref:hypothetical protein n=1 Tax=unclassified Mesorhizobium TaxID=325217 RepID=UPI000FCC608B|nr:MULTISPECIES: hypothetical protein [unclassified Mesorhizobium]MCT2581149.1 hypothetical protein [Mesorhizobium sp. P13.3]MDF3170091.1 hypothetical protein [Mesorhizobium sp. P16.1]MDF3181255.1 hypothetical protein [Mesorhizobium sp. P17.1]MDF3187061.1 hypothetical protein [Mesorhizobium sp. ICCV3110.1]RUV55441.1 hypothetical protein EOA64_30470 [Mesorhizobium sp. M1A.F.Ca.IN.022.02.1.1]
MTTFTIDDLERAKANLERWTQSFDDYTGNNPDKYQSDIKSARVEVREIEAALKADGTIPLTEREKLENTLDRLFPNARSKEIVEHEGQRYERRFTPLERSRSRKTVTVWDRYWVKLSD